MIQAMQIFYREYMLYLRATKTAIKELKIKYQETIDQIHDIPNRKHLLSELFAAQHHLVQMNYFLMESHMRFQNYFVDFDEKQMKNINQYEKVFNKANELSRDVYYFLDSFKKNKTNDEGKSI